MTNDEVKKWLNRGRMINREIQLLEDEYRKAKNKAVTVNCSVGNEKVQTTKKNVSEGKFTAVADYSISLDRRRNELCHIKREIFEAVNAVDDGVLRTLLFARYISCKTWDEVAQILGYSQINTYRLHEKSLKMIGNVIE